MSTPHTTTANASHPNATATTATGAGVTATEIVLPGVVEPAGLQLRHRELSVPASGQVLIEVEASGVSMAEQAMRRGRYPGQPKFPFVPGYDLVGTVIATGAAADPALLGQRVAALTKTGGWASHVLLTAADVIPVAADLDPAEVETLVVNGITAWQMLHRKAHIQAGQTILVHGANGGVGTTLVQLARHAGVRVIGTASPRHHDALRTLGAVPVDYHAPDLAAQIRALAPGGVDAAFDHIGADSLTRSWQLLAPGGTLVSYSIAARVAGTKSVIPAFLATLARLFWWNTIPNGKKASFYDVWSGHRLHPATFRARIRTDLSSVLDLLHTGTLTAQIAARMPLAQARDAMTLAESHTVTGKVVLIPSPRIP